MSSKACPCGHASYQQCCQVLHLGQQHASSAAQLMRSRYSAYALGLVDYICDTTALGQQQALDRAAIQQWSERNRWLALELLEQQAHPDKRHAFVSFNAHYHDGQHAQLHHERSAFVLQQGRWYFLDPTVTQQRTQKQPCICGSNKKFKHCCAVFLTA
ncbi:YchJ family protein [Acinetobacter larvae]|uniref:SEC-C motif-containing protein n=1 Tax=Acinetobacter larvae TaxID=1789224 RepID=A0A1B2M3D4_9GAMM|nr:YchJ family protein [Acinetobacter larvae]AOA59692.1 SEC-C motif-containing protein [Acinetobacter larvae]